MKTGTNRYARYACLTPKRAGNLLKKDGGRPLLETVYSKLEASSYRYISMWPFPCSSRRRSWVRFPQKRSANALCQDPSVRHTLNSTITLPGATEVVAFSSRKSRLGIGQKTEPTFKAPK